MRSLAGLLGLLLVIGTTAAGSRRCALLITTPNAPENREGGANNCMPFFWKVAYQQVYSASQFSALAGPTAITRLRFRHEGCSPNGSPPRRGSATSRAVTDGFGSTGRWNGVSLSSE